MLFSEGLSNAIESGGLNSVGRETGPVFLPKARGRCTGCWGSRVGEQPSGEYVGT